MALTEEEIRILGCLIEKEATTPDQYPLSTNALVNACNQKSNRHPVTDYDERLVIDSMLLLRPAGLARTVTSGRSDKHKHVLDEAWGLSREELAVLAPMMLRGPQSPGELKTRTERYPTGQGSGFADLHQIEAVLTALAARPEPLVMNIGRGSGQSQDRWAHLLGEEVPDVNDVPPSSASSGGGGSRVSSSELAKKVEALEARLAVLEDALGVTPPATEEAAPLQASSTPSTTQPEDDQLAEDAPASAPHADLSPNVIRSDGY